MNCTSCGKPLSFIRRGLTVGNDLLCPDCFAEVPPQGEMARLVKYYRGLETNELLALLEKGTRRHRVYALKAAKDELVSRGGPSADRAQVIFSSLPNSDYFESLIERQVAAEYGGTPRPEAGGDDDASDSSLRKPASDAFLTTESSLDQAVARRLEIVSAEAAINMRGLRDFLVGTLAAGEAKSLAPMAELQNAKRSVLDALRQKARELGADAVVGITIRYEQLGAGINMLLVAATGTAVRLAGPTENPQTRTEPSDVPEPVNIPVYTFDPSPDDGQSNLA